MKVVDIHRGNPNVLDAIDHFYEVLKKSYRDKDKIIKIITGYGSRTGISRIKDNLISELDELLRRDQIEEYIWGSDLDITSNKYHEFKSKVLIPQNEKYEKNPGAVFIVLCES